MAQKKEQSGNKEEKKNTNLVLKKTGAIIGLVILLVGVIIFSFNIAYKNKIMPRTYIGGINLGGKTRTEAAQVLQNEIKSSTKSNVELKYADQSWQIKNSDLALSYNDDASVEAAWRVGREGDLSETLLEQFRSVFVGNRKPVVFEYNSQKLNSSILDIAQKINITEKDATVEIKDLQPVVIESQSGQKLDFDKSVNDVLTAFGSFSSKAEVTLSVSKIQPKIGKDVAQTAANQVKAILNGSITLKSQKQDYTIQPDQYAGWLSFVGVPSAQSSSTQKVDLKSAGSQNNVPTFSLSVTTDSAKVNAYIDSIAGNINQSAQDAKFQVQDGKVTAFQNSQTGYELDKTKSYQLISQAVLAELSTNKTVSLPVKETQPQVTSDSAASMGLNELVGDGKTSWKGSPSNRIHNLTLGSQKISGTIIQPGQEFSTIKTIGVIDASTGFLQELVIKNSTQVTPEYGGGLCQVSTTLFRAVMNSGLKVTERTNHSFRVSYYEPPVGEDATIYDPAPDFKFVNDMSTPILIWAIAGQNTLEFQIYGTKDGRKVEVSTPWVGNYVTPGNAVYTQSASMSPDTVRQVEHAVNGCTAIFTYKVTSADGKQLENETFTSKYVPVPNSFLYGEGYTPPSG